MSNYVRALALLCESIIGVIMLVILLMLRESAGAHFIAIGRAYFAMCACWTGVSFTYRNFVIAYIHHRTLDLLTGSSVRIVSILDSCSGNGGG